MNKYLTDRATQNRGWHIPVEIVSLLLAAATVEVWIPALGTLEVREHAARQGRNPRTGETVEIAAKKVPAFKAAKALKDAVE